MLSLISKWQSEARRHERAADEILAESGSDFDSEERSLHLERARTFRECAAALVRLQ
jgi:hypothetical protein